MENERKSAAPASLAATTTKTTAEKFVYSDIVRQLSTLRRIYKFTLNAAIHTEEQLSAFYYEELLLFSTFAHYEI